MKKNCTHKYICLLGGAAMSVALSSSITAFADDAVDIEGGASPVTVTYDNYSGSYPIITAIESQPGSFGGHTYTGWSYFAQDSTGSMDIFASSSSINNGNVNYTPTVGDAISATGEYSPFHQIPEIENGGATYGALISTLQSTGNALPATAGPGSLTPQGAYLTTIGALTATPTPIPQNLAGYYLQLNNVTIGGTGGVGGLFPTYAQATVATETFTITDATGTMTMFDWVTSYSTDGAMAGSAVPTGPVNMEGFVSYNTGGPEEFTPTSIQAVVPEPSVLALCGEGAGAAMALFYAFRKKA
jgi:hypothetical protein